MIIFTNFVAWQPRVRQCRSSLDDKQFVKLTIIRKILSENDVFHSSCDMHMQPRR